MRRKFLVSIICIMMSMILASCSILSSRDVLDPENPITVTVWNYYNGSVKDKFDELVAIFNETIGAEKGIVIEAQSYGDVNELADAVFATANNEIGSLPMPDIFAAYSDNAFRVKQITDLVNFSDYFSKAELAEIRKEFLDEGSFGTDGELYILPIAKSTENLYLNKTYWDEFAAKKDVKLTDLSTWEGLVNVSKIYYEYSGKAFFGVDANANYMLVSAMQMGNEMYLYDAKTNTVKLNFNESDAYRIWKNYYIPYISGYFMKSGRFSSDDARTGLIAAYTGSTAGASYFPVEISDGDNIIPIEVITLPYPFFDGGDPYVVQQGAGMCIAKSDEAHEFASAVFLKWFIDLPQNIEFAVSTGYLPVKTKALNADTILSELDNTNNNSNDAVRKSIVTTIDMLKTHTLYGNKPFEGSYECRGVLETNLQQLLNSDLAYLNKQVDDGYDRSAILEELTSDKHFQRWYLDICNLIQEAIE